MIRLLRDEEILQPGDLHCSNTDLLAGNLEVETLGWARIVPDTHPIINRTVREAREQHPSVVFARNEPKAHKPIFTERFLTDNDLAKLFPEQLYNPTELE